MRSARFTTAAALVMMAMLLAGCSATSRNAAKGGLIGASVGATGAVLTNRSVERGAILGGGAGAALGAIWD